MKGLFIESEPKNRIVNPLVFNSYTTQVSRSEYMGCRVTCEVTEKLSYTFSLEGYPVCVWTRLGSLSRWWVSKKVRSLDLEWERKRKREGTRGGKGR